MSFAETTSSRTLPPLSSALGQTVAVSHGVSLQQALTLPPVSFLSNYGSPPQLHSVPPTQPPTSTTAYVVTALPQYQPAAQQQLSPSSTITTTVTTAHHIPSSTRAMPILPKLGREYTSPPPSLLPSPSSTRDYPDLRTSPTLTSASAVLAGSPPSHSYYPRPTSSTSSEHHHHHHHHHHSSQGHSDHYGSPPSHHSQRSGSIQPSPDEILAEKRRRNAGASARFRDRRKQRERENQDRCEYLERRVAELEKALAHATDGVLPEKEHKRRGREGKDGKSSSSGGGEHRKESLAGRVSDLETQVVRTRIEREGAYRKISELEKENSYLRSLLSEDPNLPPPTSPADSSKPSNTNSSRDRDHDRDHDSDFRPSQYLSSYHRGPTHDKGSHHHYSSYRPYPIDIKPSRSWGAGSENHSPCTTSTMSVSSDGGAGSPRSSDGSLSSPR